MQSNKSIKEEKIIFQNEEEFPPTAKKDEQNKVYDYVIVGGGIAGICVAEIFTRAEKSVLLVEKESKIATESSGEQHCWGQFGYLYLNLPDPGVAEACVQNVNLLLSKYPLPGNNLEVDADSELISNYPNNPLNWYRDEHVFYFYGLPDDKRFALTSEEKKSWTNKLENVVVRTKVLSEYTWPTNRENEEERIFQDLIESKTESKSRSANESSHDHHGTEPIFPRVTDKKMAHSLLAAKKTARGWMHKVAKNNPNGAIATRLQEEKNGIRLNTEFVIESHDRPMRSKRILQSVYNRFKMQNGDTTFDAEITDYKVLENGLVEISAKDGKKIFAKKVIFTAGSGLNKIDGTNVKTVKSPLLIVPKVCDKHIVFLTPKQQFTINHLHHEDYKSGKAYSIIGNGDAVDPNDEQALEESRRNIIRQAGEVFPNLKNIPESERHVYFGLKTEFMQNNERNYHYALIPLVKDSEQVWAAVPGKFTLAPSLANHVYQKFEGCEPPSLPYSIEEEEEYVKSAHLRVTMNGDIVNRNPLEKNDPDELETRNLQPARTDSSESNVSSVGDTLHGQIIGGNLGNDDRTLSQRNVRNVLDDKTQALHINPQKTTSSTKTSADEETEDNSNECNMATVDNNRKLKRAHGFADMSEFLPPMYSPPLANHRVARGIESTNSGKDEEISQPSDLQIGKFPTRHQTIGRYFANQNENYASTFLGKKPSPPVESSFMEEFSESKKKSLPSLFKSKVKTVDLSLKVMGQNEDNKNDNKIRDHKN